MLETSNIEKGKNLKFITKLIKDTTDNKLNWKNNYNTADLSIFVSHFTLTKNKELMFLFRSSEKSIIQSDNVLRIVFKKEHPKTIEVIKTIYIDEYPSLIALTRILHNKYLKYDFKSSLMKPDNKVEIEIVNDLEEYRKIIRKTIREIMTGLSRGYSYDSNLMQIVNSYNDCKTASTFEELNDLLYKAKQTAERNNPIGSPRWSNS